MKKLLLVLVLILTVVFPQRQKNIVKIGCIDIQKIIDKVSSDRTLKAVLENKKSDFLKKAEKLAKEVHQLKELLTVEGKSLSAERRASIKEEILFKEEELKKFINERDSLLRQNEEILSASVLREVYSHVKDVSIKLGFSMIVEKSTAVIYADDEVDITDEVLKSMAKEVEKFKTGG